MFRQLKNIESSFKHIRLFSFVLIGACIVISCYAIYESYRQVASVQGKVYILSNGKLLEATAADRRANIPVELKDHVRSFHYWFFTLDPDEKANTLNLTKALYLADATARSQYDALKESGYYSDVVSGNITQRIEEDSIAINVQDRPYRFRYYGRLIITRPTSIVTRSLVTEGRLREVSQSDHNPHGYLIEKWRITDNHDIRIQRR